MGGRTNEKGNELLLGERAGLPSFVRIIKLQSNDVEGDDTAHKDNNPIPNTRINISSILKNSLGNTHNKQKRGSREGEEKTT